MGCAVATNPITTASRTSDGKQPHQAQPAVASIIIIIMAGETSGDNKTRQYNWQNNLWLQTLSNKGVLTGNKQLSLMKINMTDTTNNDGHKSYQHIWWN